MTTSKIKSTSAKVLVVALWEVFHIENKHFDLDTLRVPNRSPTPISKANDFLGQSTDIWGSGPPFPAYFGGSLGPGWLKNTNIC